MLKAGDPLILDTSVIIAGFKRDPEVLASFGSAGTLYVPVTVYGEPYTGALKSATPEKKLEQLAEFMKAAVLLDVDWSTAQHYGRLRKQLEENGTPIPENDIWIAAITVQYGHKLLSADAHFDRIGELNLESFQQ